MKSLLKIIIVIILLIAVINQYANDQLEISLALLWLAHGLRIAEGQIDDEHVSSKQ